MGSVVVCGGGVCGIEAALELANVGVFVHLVEKSPTIGGSMAMLDKTFPTDECAMCILSPKLVECGRHKNIEILTNATVVTVSGEPGNYKVLLKIEPRYVRVDRCVACGACEKVCPVSKEDEFNLGLSFRKAIYRPFPQAYPGSYVIDGSICTKCGKCQKVCKNDAIDLSQKVTFREISAGAVIFCPGFKLFDPSLISEYGYSRYKDVITSMEFERIISPTGPTKGEIRRPSDGKIPKRIAWIQCVGSRDTRYMPYCSAICCMYALKEAMIAKQHGIEDVCIFFIDMRCYRKGFERYYNRAKSKGVRFVRQKVAGIEGYSESGSLIVKYGKSEGGVFSEPFDMVVLSVAMLSQDIKNFEKGEHNFMLPEQDGAIFFCGTTTSPKDIPSSLVETIGCAQKASLFVGKDLSIDPDDNDLYPTVSLYPPRIGFFICHCGNNIASVVDVKKVRREISKMEDVVLSEDLLYACSQDSQRRIEERIKKYHLNRVVVASCSPRDHEELFRETIKRAGLNPYLFEMANIREQCSWVHGSQKEKATEKALDLCKMAVSKARFLEPSKSYSSPVIKRVLVVGGGVAGMEAALSLSKMGIDVTLVEREDELGGNARSLYYTLLTDDVRSYLDNLISSVLESPNIEVLLETEIDEVGGYSGNFETTLRTRSSKKTISHGAVILAIGAREMRPYELFHYGDDPRIISQRTLERWIAKGEAELTKRKRVAMIQCVRSKERPYCSRVCCGQAVKNSVKLKKLNPKTEVFVFYRDIRTYGFYEDKYREARNLGVLFMRYEEDRPPEVIIADGVLKINFFDPILQRDMELIFDMIVLGTGVEPHPETLSIARLFKVPVDEDGFFLEVHPKLRPLDFSYEGIFLAGICHQPLYLEESIKMAKASAMRAASFILKGEFKVSGYIATVCKEKCVGCATCARLCPFGAITVKEKAEINPLLCKGCGICGASCPKGAIHLPGFSDEGIAAMLDAASF